MDVGLTVLLLLEPTSSASAPIPLARVIDPGVVRSVARQALREATARLEAAPSGDPIAEVVAADAGRLERLWKFFFAADGGPVRVM